MVKPTVYSAEYVKKDDDLKKEKDPELPPLVKVVPDEVIRQSATAPPRRKGFWTPVRCCVLFTLLAIALVLLSLGVYILVYHLQSNTTYGVSYDSDDGDYRVSTDQMDNFMTEAQELMNEIMDIDNDQIDWMARKRRDCDTVLDVLGGYSGIYEIQPSGVFQPFDVYCEMTESGAWTVIQRRQDGSVNFTRNWADYKVGFGNINGEYWMGNDNIYRLTNQASYKLRIDLEQFDGDTRYAEYETFWIDSENNSYVLHLGQYSGTAGDAMKTSDDSDYDQYLDGQSFSTYDNDNAYNCASIFHGGWWFNACIAAYLNGLYYTQQAYHQDAIKWPTWNTRNIAYSLKSSTMKIQKIN